MSKKPPHKVIRTILIVGEGYAEYALLNHLKRLYHLRGSGFTIKLNNARGKGAAQVIDHAIGQKRNIAYDVVAALLDTDKDWNAEVHQRAKEHGMLLFPCEPCLEAELLRIHVKGQVNGTTEQIKRQFLQHYMGEAQAINYSRHFPAVCLDPVIAEALVPLGGLMHLIKTGDLPPKQS